MKQFQVRSSQFGNLSRYSSLLALRKVVFGDALMIFIFATISLMMLGEKSF